MKTVLKWAGSKSRIMDTLKQHLPGGDRLVEPFAGSCSVMMNTDYPAYLVADINPDLINFYEQVQDSSRELISMAEYLFAYDNNEVSYYQARQYFNGANLAPIERAAFFFYLNRHCFNGLCRYNRAGYFNVPYGKYKQPYFPKHEILAFAKKARRATFVCCSFDETLRMVQPGDVVYCDPPYLPQTATSDFSNYHTAGFNYGDHEHLLSLLRRLAQRSYPVIASNSATEQALSLYSHAGFDITTIAARRSIGASADCSQSVQEIIAKVTPPNPQYLPPDPTVDSLLMAGFPAMEEVEGAE